MLQTILQRHGFLEEERNLHYLSVLRTFPQNIWFLPTDEKNDEFTICYWFASRGMICKKDVPLFNNGSYAGMKKYYLWNEELNYKEV
jgi:hypothetical protein